MTRNLVRRRLRALVQAEAAGPGVPAGWYLIGGQPDLAEQSFAELRDHVSGVFARIRADAA